MDRREFLNGAMAMLAVAALPELPRQKERSLNDAIQKKIDELPEGGTLTFDNDVVYLNPNWKIRKSIVIQGNLNTRFTGMASEDIRSIFVLPSGYAREGHAFILRSSVVMNVDVPHKFPSLVYLV